MRSALKKWLERLLGVVWVPMPHSHLPYSEPRPSPNALYPPEKCRVRGREAMQKQGDVHNKVIGEGKACLSDPKCTHLHTSHASLSLPVKWELLCS